MNDNEAAVALLSVFVVFGLPMCVWLVFRVLRHRERMEMIRHGLDPNGGDTMWRDWMRENPGVRAQPGPQMRGMQQAYAGCDPSAQVLLRRGMTLAAVGFAVTLGLSFIGYRNGEIVPGPWLIGGLVPLFIGLAQVAIAVMSGATTRPIPQGMPQPPPSAPPPPPFAERTPSSTYEGSYTYRPGATQELRPPPPPPAEK